MEDIEGINDIYRKSGEKSQVHRSTHKPLKALSFLHVSRVTGGYRNYMELRDYQRECISAIEAQPPGAYLVQMATGLGKTVTAANIPRHGRLLWLSHREELVEQPRKYFNCSFGVERAEYRSHGEEVVSASVQTLTRRLSRFRPDDFDTIIVDECFPGTIKVDGKPLNSIKNGDIIASWNSQTGQIEYKPVTHVFKRKPSEMCVVILENGQFIPCTPNHPFYVEGVGYVPAIKLQEGFCVKRICVHNLRKANRSGCIYEKPMENKNGFFQENRKNLLLTGLLKRIFQTRIERNNGENQQKVCQRKNEAKKSDEKPGSKKENVGKAEGNRSLSENSVWKRSRAYSSAAEYADCVEGSESVCGVRNPHKIRGKIRNAISELLQGRHSDSWGNVSYRNRRRKSPLYRKKRAGQKEGVLFEHIRVARVEVREQTSDRTFGGLCPDGFVYNLEISGNHNYFADGILVHNCHHSAAKSYRRVLDYFEPRLTLGFTATPNRGDRVRLDDIFSRIIFQRDLKWGIENGYLTDIYCLRVNIGFDLSAVHTRHGDYAPGELDEAMEGTADAIAQAYMEHAKGATLIFAVSVRQANEIAGKIPGTVVVTGETRNRAEIIQRFTDGEIPCIVNCMVFTEGTDIPRVETVIIARPTQSETLYAQMVGRGLRLYPGKEKLTLIDCVGITGRASLCTAPSLLGIDMSAVPPSKRDEVQGDLFELPIRAVSASDCPESWIRNVQVVDLWAKEQKYQLHDVNWFKMPDGSLVCSLLDQKRITIPCPDAFGMVRGRPMQEVLDEAYRYLSEQYAGQKYLWDIGAVKRWGKAPATQKQLDIIRKCCKGFDTTGLTKGEASQIMNRLFNGPGKGRETA